MKRKSSKSNENDNFMSSISSIVEGLVENKEQAKVANEEELTFLQQPASNIIEFVSSPSYLNIKTLFAFNRQYQVLRDFFGLYCPICNSMKPEARDAWGKSRETLESEVLLVWSNTYNDDVCPKCATTRAELVQDELIREYNHLHAIVGMRSGKTVTAAQIGNYVEHRLVNLALRQPTRNLADYFGLLPEGAFEMTFIASSETQSADTIWTIYRNLRGESAWFKRYVEWIKLQEAIQEHKPGMEKWKYLETGKEIRNDYFNLKLNSKNSNSAGLAGRTRIAAMIDELCRFQQSEGASLGAEEAFRVMDNSLRTVRSAVKNHGLISWLGLNMTISSPISVDDYGMTLLDRAKTTPSMYAIHKATWEWNPNEKIEYFEEAMANDPVGTMRDFGARPPLSANPLITNIEIFNEKAIDPNLKPSAEIVTMPFTDKIGTPYFRAMMTSCEFRRDVPRYVVFDAGQMFDSFTGACAHVELVQNPDGSHDFVTVFDWIMRVLPNSTTQVWFDSAEQIIEEMLKYQKIARVEFDHWQSVSMIQHIRNLGVQADTKTIKPDDFVKFVVDTSMNKVRMLPKHPDDDNLDPPMKSPQAVALYEISKLERSMDGSKIYNANKGKKRGYNSDDCARVVVHVHKLVQESQVIPQGAKARSKESRLKSETLNGQSYITNQLGTVYHPHGSIGAGKGGSRRW